MNYLKKYNLTDEDIKEISNNIDEMDTLEYDIHEENISKILDYFVKRKVNIKELLLKKPHLFYTDSKVLINKLNEIEDEDLLKVNEDVNVIDELI